MYVKSSKSYKQYVDSSLRILDKVLSHLIALYPSIRNYYVDDMNPEEQILFDAKIVRLEKEVEIRNKCIDNIYPNEWVYRFNKNIIGREFLKRYRNIVTCMREKLNKKIEGYDFEKLYKNSFTVLEYSIRYNEMKRTNQKLSEQQTQFLEDIQNCILESTRLDSDARYAMLYLFGYIDRKTYTNNAEHIYDVYEYKKNSRNFCMKKLVRKYKEYPCLITYIYQEQKEENNISLIHPDDLFTEKGVM